MSKLGLWYLKVTEVGLSFFGRDTNFALVMGEVGVGVDMWDRENSYVAS
jgi:hypothetical protein